MLYNKLEKYSKNGIYPFHMPGHKRNFDQDLPYNIDLTEIEGFDNLHNPESCIKAVEDKAALLYSVKRAYLLVNGATGGILSAIKSLTNYGDKVIIARNCHKSVYNAIEICGLNPVYIVPDYLEDYGIYSEINIKVLEQTIQNNSDAKLLVITSPTYEGIASDIKGISNICKKCNIKLFVDESHGAHLTFSDKFPEEAINLGADVVVVSLHKTLPALTQTGLLLTNDLSLENTLQQSLSIFQTSSPSYVLMSSIEKCLDYIMYNRNIFNSYIDMIESFYIKTKDLNNIEVVDFGDFNLKYDFCKIVISTVNSSINGITLAETLRNNYGIETEMSYDNYILAMTSICDTEEGFSRLSEALIDIDKNCKLNINNKKISIITDVPKRMFVSSERYKYRSRRIKFDDAQQRVSMEYVWAYPPGVPILVPGEIISKEVYDIIKNLLDNNIEIYSSEKNLPHNISVSEI